jgi:hypothetical protein
MDNTVTFAAIVGFLVPPAVAVINREKWSSQVKGVIAFLVCLLAAIGTAWYEQSVEWNDLRKVLPIVFGAAILTYHQFWKPSGIAPTIEKNTLSSKSRINIHFEDELGCVDDSEETAALVATMRELDERGELTVEKMKELGVLK